ncbi:hypothetical protein V3N99_13380 [Dermatophilaceae bacterium Soc4.6]
MSTHEPGPTAADRIAAVRSQVAAALEIDAEGVDGVLAPFGLRVDYESTSADLLSHLGRLTWSRDAWAD